ncbi:MAG: hypothetical protein NTV34_13445 [Proteobacteria bacterium]|nr:hypothetical protein [Pseudomonadota bacterium]
MQKIDANEFDEKVNAWLLKAAGGSMKKLRLMANAYAVQATVNKNKFIY